MRQSPGQDGNAAPERGGRRRFPVSTAALLTLLLTAALAVDCAPSRRTRARAAAETEAEKPAQTEVQEQERRQPAPRVRGRAAQNRLQTAIASYLGIRYKWGGTTKEGFDCSGFVMTIYREVYKFTLPRTAADMWAKGRRVPLSLARPGDLVFFQEGGKINHVGIYTGNNRFAHAATSSGVIYSNLSDNYYAKRFVGVKRLM